MSEFVMSLKRLLSNGLITIDLLDRLFNSEKITASEYEYIVLKKGV